MDSPRTLDPRDVWACVHNVSHGDIIFRVVVPPNVTLTQIDADVTTDRAYSDACFKQTRLFARPAYGSYAAVTSAIMEHILYSEPGDLSLIRHHANGHSDLAMSAASDAQTDNGNTNGAAHHAAAGIALGLQFTDEPIAISASLLGFRHESLQTQLENKDGQVFVDGILFPHLAVLIPKWINAIHDGKIGKRAISQSQPNPTKRILYLISGTGVAGDPTKMQGSSTEAVGVMLTKFVRAAFPEVVVDHIPSADALLYDANVFYLKFNLVPKLDLHCRNLALLYSEGWRKRFFLIITMAAGAPARLGALTAALRPFMPSVMHLPNTKDFWYTGDITTSANSVQLLDFDSTEATPGVPAENIQSEDVRNLLLYYFVFTLLLNGLSCA
jgi:hypothetical protein